MSSGSDKGLTITRFKGLGEMNAEELRAKTIMELAIAAGGNARTRAYNTIDFLGRRGYVALGDLLKPIT